MRGCEGAGWYDDKSDEVPTILEEAPKLIIHDGEEQASRANVPDMEGAGSNARLAE